MPWLGVLKPNTCVEHVQQQALLLRCKTKQTITYIALPPHEFVPKMVISLIYVRVTLWRRHKGNEQFNAMGPPPSDTHFGCSTKYWKIGM